MITSVWRKDLMKTRAEHLLTEIADDLIIYLKTGTLNIDSFINELNLNIRNLRQLIRIHFVLKKEVIAFVEKLPERLRRIKTSTLKTTSLLHGEVKGRIDWQSTIKNRCKGGFADKTIFCCNQIRKNFNIKENLVLKELLDVIQTTLSEDLLINERSQYNWLENWVKDKNLYKKLDNIYFRNIYIKKIVNENIKVTDRMINDTKKSRNVLYREAAELLEFYRKIINPFRWNEEDVRNALMKLFNETFIRPEKEEVLFELYWVIKIINNFREMVEFNIIDGKNNMVACWEDKSNNYSIYHDSAGSGSLQFQVQVDELEDSCNPYLQRIYHSQLKRQEIMRGAFRNVSNIFWEGRPDIVLEVRDKYDYTLKKVLIGEVKYTTNSEYAKKGLKELLEYIALVKCNNVYFNDVYLKGERVKGVLFLDNVDLKAKEFGCITIFNIDRLRNEGLKNLL